DWREDAQATLERYRLEKAKEAKNYNILYANTQTTVPALYNSEPIPDIRRRFAQKDPAGELAATILERALSIQAEMYDFDACMQAAVRDRQLQGRGLSRVRVITGANGTKAFTCEPVIWDDYRRGPAKRWDDIPWEAFRHKLTRDELLELNPKRGAEINLDIVLSDAKDKDGNDLPDIFKRAEVWEIWDKAERRVYWIAKSDMQRPLAVTDDPYNLRKFLSTPRPLYAIESTDSLVPVCEYMQWKPLADEMDTLTKRISMIVAAAKWRGIYDGALERAVRSMGDLADGELAPAEDAARVMQQGSIDKAIWIMPVEGLVSLVKELYGAREACKQQIYEITGVADILRGSTNANETATAQQIKAQWGSLRLQEAQREVQRYARDLYRLLADLMADQLTLPEFVAMTGVELPVEPPPQPGQIPSPPLADQVAALLSSDLQREFLVEIETDSTIRADLGRHQENIGQFIQGFGAYWQSMLPAIQAGLMPADTAARIAASFTRTVKLGRDVQVALNEWIDRAEQQAKQPPEAKPDPAMEMEKAKLAQTAQIEQVRLQQDAQDKERRFQLDAQKAAAENDRAERQMAFEQQDREAERAFQREQAEMQAANDIAQKRMDREHQSGLAHEQHRVNRALERMRTGTTDIEEIDDMKPDELKALTDGLAAQAAAVTALAQAVVQQGQDTRQGLGALAEAVLADTEIVRGSDGRPAGARKVMMRRQ
ncbi:MAG: hypothetical protein AB7O43_17375, partial [Hyphomicrobiaceae bacterium]